MKRMVIVTLSGALIAVASAALGEFQFGYLLAALGLWVLVAGSQKALKIYEQGTKWQNRVDVAMWGPEDGNGDRAAGGGLVGQVQSITVELPRLTAACEKAANDAAEARKSQQIILKALTDREK